MKTVIKNNKLETDSMTTQHLDQTFFFFFFSQTN